MKFFTSLSVSLFFVAFSSQLVAEEPEDIDIYDKNLPNAEQAAIYQDPTKWTGTVVLRNISTDDDFHPEYYGNANSIVEFNGITPKSLPPKAEFSGTIKLTNQSDGKKAWVMGDGYSTYATGYTIAKLTGSGDYEDVKSGIRQQIIIKDGSTFTGNLTIRGNRWFFGSMAVESTGAGRIMVEEGQTISFSGQTWDAGSGISFGETLKVIGDAGDYIIMPKPETIPNVVNAQGEVSDLMLKYDAGRLRIIVASARDMNGKNYETIEEAIEVFSGGEVSIMKDTMLEVEKLAKNKAFTVNRHNYRFGWVDAENKFIGINNRGKFCVYEGQTNNGLSSFLCYLLNLKPQTGDGEMPDRPFLKLMASEMVNGVVKAKFGFFHAANCEQIQPRADFGMKVKCQIMCAGSPDSAEWAIECQDAGDMMVTIDLPQPELGQSAVRYFKPSFAFE